MHVIDLNQQQRSQIIKFLDSPVLTTILLSQLQIDGVITSDERQLIVAPLLTKDKLVALIEVLAMKDKGFDSLLDYLRLNGYGNFAIDLTKECTEVATVTLEMLLGKLAEYYKEELNVWTPHRQGQPIANVFGPLSVIKEGQKHNSAVATSVMLEYLHNKDNPNVLLLQGDVGSGKSTLLKKIAYDWADRYQKGMSEKTSFSVVLHVPLQYITVGCDDLLGMTVDYLLFRLQITNAHNRSILKQLKEKGAEVLLCLDGLESLDVHKKVETPLRQMFAPPFKQDAKYSKEQLPVFKYKILVTARPYACEPISPEMRLSIYNLTPLHGQHLMEFPTKYCEAEGVKKFQEYVSQTDNSLDVPIHNPLFCLLLCFLIDSDDDGSVLGSRPFLFDRCHYHMLRWAVKQYKLAEDIHLTDEWTTTNVACKTSSLASVGLDMNKTTFDHRTLAANDVPDDSFVCGFILFRFDRVWDRRWGLFIGPTIQEYFASLKHDPLPQN